MPVSLDTHRVPAFVELLDSLAFVAIEHGGALDLVHFTAYVDLYARHLETAATEGVRTRVSFETFVGDEVLLRRAAAAAERESGVPTRAPAPLGRASLPRAPRLEAVAEISPDALGSREPSSPPASRFA